MKAAACTHSPRSELERTCVTRVPGNTGPQSAVIDAIWPHAAAMPSGFAGSRQLIGRTPYRSAVSAGRARGDGDDGTGAVADGEVSVDLLVSMYRASATYVPFVNGR